jgi:hypothetical protein
MTKAGLFSICIFCLLGCLTSIKGHSEPAADEALAEQSRQSYEAAFRVISSSPPYVLITVIDDNTGKAQRTCTYANFLLGAIELEYGLRERGASGVMKSTEVVLQNRSHVFHFRNSEALRNIRVRYSESELSAARALLAPLPTDELTSKFSSLYSDRRLNAKGYAKDAIACALIERGLSPKSDDISGQVYIEKTTN